MLIHEVTAPTAEPVLPEELHAHCRIPDDAEDSLLQVYISSARQLAEAETARQLMPATLELVRNAFPPCAELVLPRAPLIEVVSIKYFDDAGVEQTFDEDEYVVDAFSGDRAPPGLVRLAYGSLWPTTQSVARAVRIRFRAGYVSGTGEDEVPNVPAAIRHAVMVGAAESYKNREESIQGTISSEAAMTMRRLLGPYRVIRWE